MQSRRWLRPSRRQRPRREVVCSSGAPAGCRPLKGVLERLGFLRGNAWIRAVTEIAKMIGIRLAFVTRLFPQLEPGPRVPTQRRRHREWTRIHERIVDRDF